MRRHPKQNYQEGDYSSEEDDGSFLGWNHTQRQSVLSQRRSEPSVPDDNARRRAEGHDRGETNITNYSEMEEQQQPSLSSSRNSSMEDEMIERLVSSKRESEQTILTSNKDDGDADASTTSSSSDTSSDAEELDEDDSIAKPSLCVRIIKINCPLPPKLREISSSFVPAFQLGLVKESKKSDFLFGAKPKMSRTVITSSQVINRVEEVRWDNLHKNSLEDLFLGVELRIWGWFPEVLQHCEELMDKEESLGAAAAENALAIAEDDESGNNPYNEEYQESKIETRLKGFVRNRMSFLGGSHDRPTPEMQPALQVQHELQYEHNQYHEERIREDASSQEEQQQQHQPPNPNPNPNPNSRRSKNKVPSIRLGTLLIPIQNVGEGAAMEKNYALNFKVSGGTRDMRKLIEKLLGVEQPVVTLKLEIQLSPSFQELNISEDILLLQNLKSLKSRLLPFNMGSTSAEDCEEDEEADEEFIEQNFGSSMFSDTESVSSMMWDRRSSNERRSSLMNATGAPIAPTTVARKDSVKAMEPESDATEAEPIVKPGIIDFICMVGAQDIGDQRTHDDGSKGWLPTNPEYNLMEQFPSQTFHSKNGRNVILPDKIEYFCFPERCKVWRGTEPPSAADMNLPPRNGDPCGSYSANGVPNNTANSSTFLSSAAGSTQAFDECLNCTTTLTWFVLQSNSDEYGSRCMKNYGVCIRFFVPAPNGIDCTQDDYAQSSLAPEQNYDSSSSKKKRNVLWVPLGICVMTRLPIVGTMEAVLLRVCQTLCNRRPRNLTIQEYFRTKIYKDLANLIVNYPSPIYGVLHCSIPFLQGQRLHVTLPPFSGLPPLPHGGSVTAVCRLLGAEGFTILLAAFLTECKILLHSHDISNLAMVAEVFSAMIYPFSYVLPYIPVLPEQVLEYIESPVPYCLGVSSKSMNWIDRKCISDVVVIDLDNGFHTPDYFDGRSRAFKLPSPLPAAVCQSVHKNIFLLLRQEEDIEEQYGHHMYYNTSFSACYPSVPRHLPRLESESLAEREFRIHVAIQVCSLVRGYQDCLFLIGASQPVFNRDKFLRYAPALFEERACSSASATPNGSSTTGLHQEQATSQKILSPRSKRFLSLLANTQQFHQLLERLDMEDLNFFHEIMDTFDWEDSPSNGNGDEAGNRRRNGTSNNNFERRKDHLSTLLEKTENSIPTYRVDRRYFDKCLLKVSMAKDNESSEECDEDEDSNDDDDFLYDSSETSADEDYDEFDLYEDDLNQNYDNYEEYCLASQTSYFTKEILKPIIPTANPLKDSSATTSTEDEDLAVHSLSVKYLELLDKNPWNYEKIFPMVDENEGKDDMTDNTTPKLWDVCPKITLRQAIGEQRYKAYCIEQQKLSGTVVEEDEEDESIARNAMDNSLTGSSFRNNTAKYELVETRGTTPDESPRYPQQQQTTDVAPAPADDDKFLDLNTLLSLAYEEMDVTPSDEAHEPIRQCLSTVHDTKNEEWIQNAEKALRSPSTYFQSQTFLLCVLSQRNHVDYPSNIMKQPTMHRITPYQRPHHQGVVGGVGIRPSTAPFHHSSSQKNINVTGSATAATSSNISKLTLPAFETLIRLCSSMLDVCLERHLYENAYRLLSNTAGFCCIGTKSIIDVIYMPATISMHPIFADLRLWEKVLILHRKDQHHQTTSASSVSGTVTTTSSTALSHTNNPNLHLTNKSKKERSGTTPQQTATGAYSSTDAKNESEHDAAVTTLYEMLGYGLPAEELASFATRVSEARNWFATERGKNLVVLVKLLGLRRVETTTTAIIATAENSGAVSDDHGSESDGAHNMNSKEYLELIESYHPTAGTINKDNLIKNGILSSAEKEFKVRWKELSWFHPTSVDWSGKNASSSLPSIPQHPNVTLPRGYTGRTPITSIGSFSSHSCIATGGLDGSVFLAHTLSFGSPENGKPPSVRGVRLEWDSASSPFADTNTQQPYLSNAVSCLASSIPAQHYKPYSNRPDEILRSLDGCFIIAGTYAGSLNVWNAHDIYYSTVVALRNRNSDGSSHDRNLTTSAASILSNATASTANALSMELQHGGSTYSISEKKLGMTLRGKALCGHKRGVLCIDVPSPIYRPDTVVTGGADGQIKLWSLRNTVSTSSLSSSSTPAVAAMFAGKGQTTASIGIPSGSNNAETEMASSNTDSCVSALSGHKGKVLCLRTYWHGDQLLSGGSDKTVRLWDLSASSSTSANRCLQKFACHSGDVTQVHYCGPHTIVSASTDRTIAICDARVGALPVHVLRYHKSHVSDLLLGSQSDNTMISASGDGTIATWDLRSFQTSNVKKQQDLNDIQILRSPVAVMKHSTVTATNKSITGSIKLSRGILSDKTIFSASIDGIVKEWNISSGVCIGDIHTGHSGAISCLSSYSQQSSSYYPKHDQFSLDSSLDDNLSNSVDESSTINNISGGLLTCGWDGSIRFRKCNVSNSSNRAY